MRTFPRPWPFVAGRVLTQSCCSTGCFVASDLVSSGLQIYSKLALLTGNCFVPFPKSRLKFTRHLFARESRVALLYSFCLRAGCAGSADWFLWKSQSSNSRDLTSCRPVHKSWILIFSMEKENIWKTLFALPWKSNKGTGIFWSKKRKRVRLSLDFCCESFAVFRTTCWTGRYHICYKTHFCLRVCAFPLLFSDGQVGARVSAYLQSGTRSSEFYNCSARSLRLVSSACLCVLTNSFNSMFFSPYKLVEKVEEILTLQPRTHSHQVLQAYDARKCWVVCEVAKLVLPVRQGRLPEGSGLETTALNCHHFHNNVSRVPCWIIRLQYPCRTNFRAQTIQVLASCQHIWLCWHKCDYFLSLVWTRKYPQTAFCCPNWHSKKCDVAGLWFSVAYAELKFAQLQTQKPQKKTESRTVRFLENFCNNSVWALSHLDKKGETSLGLCLQSHWRSCVCVGEGPACTGVSSILCDKLCLFTPILFSQRARRWSTNKTMKYLSGTSTNGFREDVGWFDQFYQPWDQQTKPQTDRAENF